MTTTVAKPLVHTFIPKGAQHTKSVDSSNTPDKLNYFTQVLRGVQSHISTVSSEFKSSLQMTELALCHGEIAEHVAKYIISKNGSASDKNLIQDGVQDFLQKNASDSKYDSLKEGPTKSNLSNKEITYSPLPSYESTTSRVINSPAKILKAAHWGTTYTSGHMNNCGIFAMFPGISSEKAQTKRYNLLTQLKKEYDQNSFTEVDYSYMQMNLPKHAAKETMTHEEIFTQYIANIRRGNFLDPFALQKIAAMSDKHLLILDRHSPTDCKNTLEQIRTLNHIPADKEVAFIAHNGSNHFEQVIPKIPSARLPQAASAA